MSIRKCKPRIICAKLVSLSLSIVLMLGSMPVFAQGQIVREVDFAAGTPIIQALRALGYSYKRNVIISGEVTGSVVMHMDNVSFEQALEAMSIACGFGYVVQGDNVIISSKEKVNSTKVFPVKYANLDGVAAQLKSIVGGDRNVVVNKELNTITVSGSASVLNAVEKNLAEIDRPIRQVMIRAAVIELNNTKTDNRGINYSQSSKNLQYDSSSGSTISPPVTGVGFLDGILSFTHNDFKFKINASLESAMTRGKVLARPSVATSDGVKATIMMGDQVPVFTSTASTSTATPTVTVEYKDVGVKLEVTPRVNDYENELITLNVNPKVSVISQWVESGNNKAPQISERSAQTKIRVKSGETILIGGLLKDEEVKTLRRIPILSKIPILGALFRSTSKERKNSEVVIAITPVLIKDDAKGRPMIETQRTTLPLKKEVQIYKDEQSELNDDVAVEGVEEEKKKRADKTNLDYHAKKKKKAKKVVNDVASDGDEAEVVQKVTRKKIRAKKVEENVNSGSDKAEETTKKVAETKAEVKKVEEKVDSGSDEAEEATKKVAETKKEVKKAKKVEEKVDSGNDKAEEATKKVVETKKEVKEAKKVEENVDSGNDRTEEATKKVAETKKEVKKAKKVEENVDSGNDKAEEATPKVAETKKEVKKVKKVKKVEENVESGNDGAEKATRKATDRRSTNSLTINRKIKF